MTDEALVNAVVSRNPAASYRWTDKDYSALFADLFRSELRYNRAEKCWYAFNGVVWGSGADGAAHRAARQLVDALHICVTRLEDGKAREDFAGFVGKLEQFGRRKTLVEDAKSLLECDMSVFDQHAELLNFPNGTLNLSTLELRPHSASDMLTRCCGADYKSDANTSKWESFLFEIMQGDAETSEYLQRLAGYFLTADTSLETAFMLYGSTTRNGKSTFAETLRAALGSYAAVVSPETLCESRKNGAVANPELAALRGARLVICGEFSQAAALDTALFKRLTGGNDTISTRKLYGDTFEFRPQFKLVIHTNFLPLVSDTSVFTSDRCRIIPFERHFSADERDTGLKARLTSPENLSAVLAWAVEGLRQFRAEGENPPDTVKLHTQTYKESSDKFLRFLKERMIRGSEARCTISAAYPLYAEWCKDNHLSVDKPSTFKDSVKSHGLYLASGKVNGVGCRHIVNGYTVPHTGKLA